MSLEVSGSSIISNLGGEQIVLDKELISIEYNDEKLFSDTTVRETENTNWLNPIAQTFFVKHAEKRDPTNIKYFFAFP